MTSLGEYLENPFWAKYYNYALQGGPNGGYDKRWIQGSVGMMEPMPLWSNEYGHLYMKHGQNELLPYRGNIKHFAPSVTPELRMLVDKCSHDTINPAGCQDAAIRKVFTVDSTPPYQPGGIPALAGQISHYSTPHPFNISYETGRSPQEVYIPPNVNYHR